jgi:hypothetical protein
MGNDGGKKYRRYTSKHSGISLLSAMGSEPLRVVVVLQLGRVAPHVSKGRARSFRSLIFCEVHECTMEIWQERVQKGITKYLGLMRSTAKEKFGVTYPDELSASHCSLRAHNTKRLSTTQPTAGGTALSNIRQ